MCYITKRAYDDFLQCLEVQPPNITVLYGRMWRDILGSIREGTKPRHTLAHGLNVADACTRAFQFAHMGGEWREVGYQWERQ